MTGPTRILAGLRGLGAARAACCGTLALLLASACGGQSFKGGGGEAGNTNTGGNSQVAGSANSGGKAHAGSGSGGGATRGGSASTAGSGSGGDSSDEGCSGPSEINANGIGCTGYFSRWSHDSATGVCLPVFYGGCGATKNNYETLEACQKACPGGSPNYDACKSATDCVLASPGCCGVCDGPSLTTHDFLAYSEKYASLVHTCDGDVACGACAVPPPSEATRKYFVPNCVRGECVVEDVRESAVTACKTNDDCSLRLGTGCCQSCNGNDVVAVRNDGSFVTWACSDGPMACPECATTPPAGALAYCAQTGHCSVAYAVDLPL